MAYLQTKRHGCSDALRLSPALPPQSQYVYCFELPSASVPDAPSSSSGAGPSGSGGGVNLRPEQLLCGGLGEPSSHWRMRPVNFFRTEQHSLGARVSQQHPPPDAAADEQPPGPPEQQPVRRSQRAAAVAASAAWAPLTPRPPPGSPFLTAAIGPFPVPCNLAAASPDGRWVAGALGLTAGTPHNPCRCSSYLCAWVHCFCCCPTLRFPPVLHTPQPLHCCSGGRQSGSLCVRPTGGLCLAPAAL